MKKLEEKVEKLLKKKEEKNNKLIQDLVINKDIAYISIGKVSEDNPPIQLNQVSIIVIENEQKMFISKSYGKNAIIDNNEMLINLDSTYRMIIDKRDIDEAKIFLLNNEVIKNYFSCEEKYDSQNLNSDRKIVLLIFSTNEILSIYYFNNQLPVPFFDISINIPDLNSGYASFFYGQILHLFPEAFSYLFE